MASIILPVVLLALSFVVKMSIEREVDLPKLLQSLIELPTDIMFLSSSLVIAYALTNKSNMESGLVTFISYIALSILVTLLWRKAENRLAKKSWSALLLAITGYFLAIPALVFSIFINIPGA